MVLMSAKEYSPPRPIYKVKEERDVFVCARDGTKLAVDIFRPDAGEKKFPALLALSAYGKGYESLRLSPQGTSSPLHFQSRAIEAGDPMYFAARGYVNIIGDVRGTGHSDGEYDGVWSKQQAEDGYDLVEWAAGQPWCDGNVGMVGISYFGTIQLNIAAEQPPHLKAIVPWNSPADFYRESTHQGGILHMAHQWLYAAMIGQENSISLMKKRMKPEDFKRLCDEIKADPDVQMYPALYNMVDSPRKAPCFLDILLNPLDGPFYWERSAYTMYDRIKIPIYAHSGWWAYGWIHLVGAFRNYNGINAPKKLDISGRTDTEHPLPVWYCEEMLRWFDYWLKGIDTGIMSEPPIKIFVMGADKWRFENEWPLARTRWTKYYLRRWGDLSIEPETNASGPDCFVQQPPSETADIHSVVYMTSALQDDVEVTGPVSFYMHASIDQEDTNWMVSLGDLDKYGSEIELTVGYLKASHRALDKNQSKPWEPYHPHTYSEPVVQDRIYEYAISLAPTSNVFRAGHKIKLEIYAKDNPGVTSATGATLRTSASRASLASHGTGHHPWHMCSSKTTIHRIYHDTTYPSYLYLPIIPPSNT